MFISCLLTTQMAPAFKNYISLFWKGNIYRVITLQLPFKAHPGSTSSTSLYLWGNKLWANICLLEVVYLAHSLLWDSCLTWFSLLPCLICFCCCRSCFYPLSDFIVLRDNILVRTRATRNQMSDSAQSLLYISSSHSPTTDQSCCSTNLSPICSVGVLVP